MTKEEIISFLQEQEFLTEKILRKARLVNEVFDEATDDKIIEQINAFSPIFGYFRRNFPYLLIRTMCWIALRYYDQDSHGYWLNYKKELYAFGQENQNELGTCFVRLIRASSNNLYGFEHLKDHGSMKYVRLIVLHGGIPSIYFERYFTAMYKAFCDNNYSPDQFIEQAGFSKAIKNYFYYCEDYARTFYFNTLELIKNINEVDSIQLPGYIKEAFVDWKNKSISEHNDIQRKLTNLNSGTILLALDKENRLCILIQNMVLPREYSQELHLQIDDIIVKEKFNINDIKETTQRIRDVIIKLSDEIVALLLKNKTLVISYGTYVLKFINLFDFNQNFLSFFKDEAQTEWNLLVKTDKKSDHLSHYILAPAEYVIQIPDTINNKVDVMKLPAFTLIWFEDYTSLMELIILNDEVPIKITNTNLLSDEYNIVPYLLYENQEIYTYKNEDNSNHYGFIKDKHNKKLMLIPEVKIARNKNEKIITLQNVNNNLTFNKENAKVTIPYSRNKLERFKVNAMIENVYYAFEYELPFISWTISEHKMQPFINETTPLIINSKSIDNKFLLIRLNNYDSIDNISIGNTSICYEKKYAKLYIVDLNSIKNNINNSNSPYVNLYVTIEGQPLKVLSIMKEILITNFKYSINTETIKISWDEQNNFLEKQKIRIWNYYCPWEYPTVYDVNENNSLEIVNDGFKNILIEWFIEKEKDVFDLYSETKDIMPLYLIEITDNVNITPQLLPHEKFNTISYDEYFDAYIRNDLLPQEQIDLLIKQKENRQFAFSNYAIIQNSYFQGSHPSALVEYIDTFNEATAEKLLLIIKYLEDIGLTHLLEGIIKKLHNNNIELIIYAKLHLTSPDSIYLRMINQLYIQDAESYLLRLIEQNQTINNEEYAILHCYIDKYWDFHEEMEILFNNTDSLSPSDSEDDDADLYSKVMYYYFCKKLSFTHEIVKADIYRKKSIWGHKFNNIEDYVLLFAKIKDLILSQYLDCLVFETLDTIKDNKYLGKYAYSGDVLNAGQVYIFQEAISWLNKIQSLSSSFEYVIIKICNKIDRIMLKEEDLFIELINKISLVKNTYLLKEILNKQDIAQFSEVQLLTLLLILSEQKLLYKSSDFKKFFESNRSLNIDNYLVYFAMPENRKYLKTKYHPDQVGKQLLKLTAIKLKDAIDNYSELLIEKRLVSNSLIECMEELIKAYNQ